MIAVAALAIALVGQTSASAIGALPTYRILRALEEQSQLANTVVIFAETTAISMASTA